MKYQACSSGGKQQASHAKIKQKKEEQIDRPPYSLSARDVKYVYPSPVYMQW